ncbi:MAG: hypothetical protein JXR78_01360 [Victivallales bacterium]|nr:hypothetical protein [Victivallales bacterium]
MKTRIFILIIAVTIVCISLSCRSTIQRSDYQAFVQSQSNYEPNITNAKLGIIQFDCIVPFIGETISQNVKAALGDTGLTMFDTLEMTLQLNKSGINLEYLLKNKFYSQIMEAADLDYLLIGDVQIYSPRRKKIISVSAIMLDNKGDIVVKVRFEPPDRHWTMPIIGKVIANEIKREFNLPHEDEIKIN